MNIIEHPDYLCTVNDEPGNVFIVSSPAGSLLRNLHGEVFPDREAFEVALHNVAKKKHDHNMRIKRSFDPLYGKEIEKLVPADYCLRCREVDPHPPSRGHTGRVVWGGVRV